MEIKKVLALRGPNMWARSPVLEAWVDLQELKDSPSNSIPGFNDRLMGWLPSMIEHECSEGHRGGFFVRLREGTWMAHTLEHVTIELQNLAGNKIGFGRARETEQEGLYKVVFKYHDETVGRAALETGLRLILAAVYDKPFDVAAEVARLREMVDRHCLGPSTLAIVDAAKARNIPYRRLNSGSLVLLGQGCRQRRIWTAETDQTSAIAESIAQDKELTKSVLRAAGVPVPEGRAVDSPADAWLAAQELGVEKGNAIVVKPRDANHARGVFVELTSRLPIESAYHEALKEGSGVLVERFARGAEHRLLVVGNKLVAACRGDAVYITGDGIRTVRKLVDDQVNSDPRRGEFETCPLTTIVFDSIVMTELKRQGYTPDSVPTAGTPVLICRNDNLSRDVTDDVHPDVAERAVLAAAAVGLDVAGLDVIVENISRPLEDQGGVVVEVNAGPGLLMHLAPKVGKPRPVGEAIVDRMFPPGEDGRIPVVCVTGTNGKTITTLLVRAMVKATGMRVGMTTSEGVWVDDRRLEKGDCAGPRSAKNILLNPQVEAAVFECGRGGILREGLGFDFCDVAIVTNIGGGDHIGGYWIESLEKMYKVKRSGVDVVLPTGYAVLNAADPMVAEMRDLSRGGTIFFSIDPDLEEITNHLAKGKRAVFVQDGQIVLATGSERQPLMLVAEVPLTMGGSIPFQVENVLAAVAAGWALDISKDVLISTLRSFQSSLDELPARFNVLEWEGRTVILDDSRNASALRALGKAIAGLEASGKAGGPRVAVYAGWGDRRNDALVEQGKVLGDLFDRVVLYETTDLNGRAAGEASTQVRLGLADGSRVRDVSAGTDWTTAVNAAVASLEPGGLLLVQAEDIGTSVEVFRQWFFRRNVAVA
jgi:cyanophycin synthetase